MSDIYVPGVKSRFDTDKLIDGLMKVERIPKERTEKNIESLESQKTYWQEIGRRINSLRDSARLLYSFQNPFNERIGNSADSSVITATATREAVERDYRFTVKQIAQADRFLSRPLEDNFKIDAGTYTFSVGKDEVSFAFKGGSLKEFTDALNRRGKDKIGASLIAVERGAKSLLIESKVTGSENHLVFSGDAETLALNTGMVEQSNDSRRDIALDAQDLKRVSDSNLINVEENTLLVKAGASASIPLNPAVQSAPGLILQFETAANTKSADDLSGASGAPTGPAIPSAGSVTYGGITIENDPTSVIMANGKEPPPPPPRVDDLRSITLTFSDGSTAALPPINDSPEFGSVQYKLQDIAGGKTISSIDLTNRNTHRDISIRNIEIFDPDAPTGLVPKNAISIAQDAIVNMDGIEIKRPTNTIDDLIPGVTITAKGSSDRPVVLGIQPDREQIKESIISLVGNYNRLIAEVNVVTRNDAQIIEELSYLSDDERTEMKKRQGAFSGDTTLNQFKSSLQRAATTPYLTQSEQDLALLAQIGIGTDVRRSGAGAGYDASRLRGYLEIDEKTLDGALETKLSAIQQIFGYDTDGDLIVDSGVAYAMDSLTKPYVESGGFISLKTGTIDSRISQDKRRIETMERQLAAKESALKVQYGQMEGAYSRMESMSNSLDNFSQQNSNNRR
ncbi:flagellar hook-associated protein 2 [Spirochaetia bacterium]|nr:flagellar hook-associated protein 2 [Spirochaetia bacterium]